MSGVDFLEDNHEISRSYSDSSEVGDLNIGCDFQNLQPYQFEPEKQNQANSSQCGIQCLNDQISMNRSQCLHSI